ncbi:MAG: hypothetical protein H0T77_06500 [Pyrinomonadaceae bacterium]|nr:hypothetical protein [Pyrinomonadaceae bacterium]
MLQHKTFPPIEKLNISMAMTSFRAGVDPAKLAIASWNSNTNEFASLRTY